jgi:hypothetical protein
MGERAEAGAQGWGFQRGRRAAIGAENERANDTEKGRDLWGVFTPRKLPRHSASRKSRDAIVKNYFE